MDDIIGNVERSMKNPAYQWRSFMFVALQMAAGQLDNVSVVSNGEIGVLSLCDKRGASFLGGPILIERKENDGAFITIISINSRGRQTVNEEELEEVARYIEPEDPAELASYYCKIALEAVSFYLVVTAKGSLALCVRYYTDILASEKKPILTRNQSIESIVKMRSELKDLEAKILSNSFEADIYSDEFEA